MAWICLNDGFYSVVTHPTNKKLLQVRARRRGDIEKLFPKAEVIELDGRDYQFRAYLTRAAVRDAFGGVLFSTDYDNFKGSTKNKPLHDAYMAIWSVMSKLQPRAPYARKADSARQKAMWPNEIRSKA